jgi:hypothetical protein
MKRFILKESQIRFLIENELNQEYIGLVKSATVDNIDFEVAEDEVARNLTFSNQSSRLFILPVINGIEIPTDLIRFNVTPKTRRIDSGETIEVYDADIFVHQSLRGNDISVKMFYAFTKIYGNLMIVSSSIHNPDGIAKIAYRLSKMPNIIFTEETDDNGNFAGYLFRYQY